MRKVFFILSALLVLAVVTQFFLAASGAFDTAPNDESFRTHRSLGFGIVLFAFLTAIVAAVARVPGRLVGMAALVAGLGVGQVPIAELAGSFGEGGGTATTAGKVTFGLHAINGLIILKVAGSVARRAQVLTRSTAISRVGAGAEEGVGPAAEDAQPTS